MEHRPTQIIGCGDIGRRVARLYADTALPEAWVKSESSLLACRQLGLDTHLLDFDSPFQPVTIHNNARLLYTVPPPVTGQRDIRLRALLKFLPTENIRKFVLISTTGVYGDCAGDWVDETTAIQPVADRALRRADAEATLQHWAQTHAIDYLILRAPGIYASNRLPIKRLRASTPVLASEESPWSNRIHADDLARACYAALNLDVANEIINVSDDEPCSMTDYFFAVADYAGLPRPPQISLQEARGTLSAGMLSYLHESRRIDNTKMKKRLGIQLQYPGLKHGLARKSDG